VKPGDVSDNEDNVGVQKQEVMENPFAAAA